MDMKTQDMTQEPGSQAELVSALVDGQLKGEAFASTVDWLAHAEVARASWHTYHVVGEVLRTGETQGCGRDAAFLQRLRLGLQQTDMTDRADRTDKLVPFQEMATAISAVPAETGAETKLQHTSANDTFFSWKGLGLAASFAAVVLTGWTLLGSFQREQSAAQLAQTAVPVQPSPAEAAQAGSLAQAEPLVMMRDPRLDALLAAHKQFGGTSALQTPAGFLRNATFEGAAR
jgi:sigma-E factor negative regulatory protein RseA